MNMPSGTAVATTETTSAGRSRRGSTKKTARQQADAKAQLKSLIAMTGRGDVLAREDRHRSVEHRRIETVDVCSLDLGHAVRPRRSSMRRSSRDGTHSRSPSSSPSARTARPVVVRGSRTDPGRSPRPHQIDARWKSSSGVAPTGELSDHAARETKARDRDSDRQTSGCGRTIWCESRQHRTFGVGLPWRGRDALSFEGRASVGETPRSDRYAEVGDDEGAHGGPGRLPRDTRCSMRVDGLRGIDAPTPGGGRFHRRSRSHGRGWR